MKSMIHPSAIAAAFLTFAAFGIASAPATARAGTESSGGGNLIVCFQDDQILKEVASSGSRALTTAQVAQAVSVEALDLYDARQLRGWEAAEPILARPRDGETFRAYVSRIVARTQVAIPQIGSELKKSAELFRDHIRFTESGVVQIDDMNSKSLLDPTRCVAVTGAVQMQIGADSYLWLDKRLFFHPAHSDWSRGVLVLHEYLYRYARELGQTDSLNTRIAVAELIGNDPKTDLVSAVNDSGDFVKGLIDQFASLGFLKVDEHSRHRERLLSGPWVKLHARAMALVDELPSLARVGYYDAAWVSQAKYYLKKLGAPVPKATRVEVLLPELKAWSGRFTGKLSPTDAAAAAKLVAEMQAAMEARAKRFAGSFKERTERYSPRGHFLALYGEDVQRWADSVYRHWTAQIESKVSITMSDWSYSECSEPKLKGLVPEQEYFCVLSDLDRSFWLGDAEGYRDLTQRVQRIEQWLESSAWWSLSNGLEQQLKYIPFKLPNADLF